MCRLVVVSGVVAAGSVAVSTVGGATPAPTMATGAIDEEPAAAGSVASTYRMLVCGLQEVQRLERNQPRDVGGNVWGELPAHRGPNQVAVGERVQ